MVQNIIYRKEPRKAVMKHITVKEGVYRVDKRWQKMSRRNRKGREFHEMQVDGRKELRWAEEEQKGTWEEWLERKLYEHLSEIEAGSLAEGEEGPLPFFLFPEVNNLLPSTAPRQSRLANEQQKLWFWQISDTGWAKIGRKDRTGERQLHKL